MAGVIFINYRRTDANAWAHIVAEALIARFGRDRVFIDVDEDLPVGDDYRPAIEAKVDQCAAMVCLVGPNWLRALEDRRAHHETGEKLDLVTVEIERALAREISVTPLLVDHAPMPDPLQLPAEIRAFAYRSNREANIRTRAADLEALIAAIEAKLGEAAGPKPASGSIAATPSAAALARVEASLDAEDYRDIEEVFPGTSEAFEARRRRRRLEAWSTVDRADLDQIVAFEAGELFPALAAAVAEARSAIEEARRREEEARRRAEEEARRAEEEARRRAEEEARRAEEEARRREEEARRRAEEEVRRERARAEAEAARLRAAILRGDAPAGTGFSDLLSDGRGGPEMVVIPSNKYLMGSPPDEPGRFQNESPRHEVTFARPFALARYAVTFDEFDAFCVAAGHRKPSDAGWGRGRRPVINVSWHDAMAYCEWLSDETGADYRLPTEAEWECGCRAGTTTPFWWGLGINPARANYDSRVADAAGGAKGVNRGKTEPVDAFQPNAWGIFQTHGNVFEWCADAWNGSYSGAPRDGSAWVSDGASTAVLRGGSWYDNPRFLRSALRFGRFRADRGSVVGFRLARTL